MINQPEVCSLLGSSAGITDTDDETMSSAGASAGGALSLIKTSESNVVFFFFFFFFRFGSKISFKKTNTGTCRTRLKIYCYIANHGYKQRFLRFRMSKFCPKMFHCECGWFSHCNIHSKVNSHNILKSCMRITVFTTSKLYKNCAQYPTKSIFVSCFVLRVTIVNGGIDYNGERNVLEAKHLGTQMVQSKG